MSSVPEHIRRHIYKLDSNTCVYCGTEFSRRSNSRRRRVDHIVPLSQGGKTDDDNLVACCMLCNRMKADKPLIIHMLNLAKLRKAFGENWRTHVCELKGMHNK